MFYTETISNPSRYFSYPNPLKRLQIRIKGLGIDSFIRGTPRLIRPISVLLGNQDDSVIQTNRSIQLLTTANEFLFDYSENVTHIYLSGTGRYEIIVETYAKEPTTIDLSPIQSSLDSIQSILNDRPQMAYMVNVNQFTFTTTLTTAIVLSEYPDRIAACMTYSRTPNLPPLSNTITGQTFPISGSIRFNQTISNYPGITKPHRFTDGGGIGILVVFDILGVKQ